MPNFGSCCVCGGYQKVGVTLFLTLKAPEPGTGWACDTCGLPPDGAVATVCDGCMEMNYRVMISKIKFVCVGWPHQDQRIPVDQITEPFNHIEEFHWPDEKWGHC